METIDMFVHLLIALFLGSLIGLERAIADKRAGMRTYGLVSMGSALFILISQNVMQQYAGVYNFDPLRVASQIIVGIGFIGAGLIIFHDHRLYGLTTAAGLWVAAGIGMAVGFHMYILAVYVTLLTLFIFSIMWLVEQKIEDKVAHRHDDQTKSDN
jgi:putative Mg2+ transporter-C (MgtC) family protein